MARPMLLMEETALNELYLKYSQGVPVLKLIRQHKLDNKITAPTLTKLLSYVTAMNKTDDKNIAQIIHNSLYPKWFTDRPSLCIIQSNPYKFYYHGKMPLGEWRERETND